LLNSIGIGWTSVLVSGIWLIMAPVVWIVMKWGPQWREERRLKLEERKQKEADNLRTADPETHAPVVNEEKTASTA